MKLIFIRHGQTDWNVLGKIQGSNDIELNENGLKQAIELGERVKESDLTIHNIYSSKQKRAYKTALILSEATKVNCIPVDGLEEINFGKWEGLTWDEVTSNYKEEYEIWRKDRRYVNAPDGESYQDLLDRVLRVIHTILEKETKDVAIVTHGAVIMCLQCYVSNTPFNEMFKFKTANTCIVELESELFQ